MNNTLSFEQCKDFDQRASFVYSNVIGGYNDPKSKDYIVDEPKRTATSVQLRTAILTDIKDAVKSLDAIRTGTQTQRSIDLSFGDYCKDRWGFAPAANGSPESFYAAIGLNPSVVSIQSLMAMPDFNENFRWLIPEVIREAIRLGLRKNPLYPSLIAAEETVMQPKVTMPYIKMSDAMATFIGEAETVPTGSVSFGQKDVKLRKIGIGMKVTDEVIQYVAINVLSMFMQDIGVKLNLAKDVLAIDTLINGEAGNSNACPVIGVNTVYNASVPGSGITYKDLLRAGIRMGMLGRQPQSLLSNEDMAMQVLTLPEYTNALLLLAGVDRKGLNLRTPVPSSYNYDVHGAMPDSDQVMLIDNTASLIKLNAQALSVESDRIVERGVNGTYVRETTGFAKMFVDASVIIDQSLAWSSNKFPSYMDVAAIQQEGFRTRF
jgi:hypothetical protein